MWVRTAPPWRRGAAANTRTERLLRAWSFSDPFTDRIYRVHRQRFLQQKTSPIRFHRGGNHFSKLKRQRFLGQPLCRDLAILFFDLDANSLTPQALGGYERGAASHEGV